MPRAPVVTRLLCACVLGLLGACSDDEEDGDGAGVGAASEITARDVARWDTAYDWGDHAQAGYLQEEADPVYGDSLAAEITLDDIDNWDVVTAPAAAAELVALDDSRVALAGDWEADGAGMRTTCTGASDCAASTVELTLDDNRARAVLMAGVDGPGARYFDVELSVDGGETFVWQGRAHGFRDAAGSASAMRGLAAGLPLGADVVLRVTATRGRLQLEGFSVSAEDRVVSLSQACPPDWASGPDGRPCLDPAARGPATMAEATADCRDALAHVCRESELQQLCGVLGDAAYGVAGPGWYGDRAGDASYHRWSGAECAAAAGAAAASASEAYVYKCCR